MSTCHTRLLSKGGICAIVIAALPASGCGGDERSAPTQKSAQESPRLVFNRSIGDVQLDMARAEVARRYGKPARTTVFRDYFPAGTRYYGKKLIRAVYHRHGGALRVDYVDARVKTIETTSMYYRTARGIRVGAHVPHDRCMRLDEIGHTGPRGCKNAWRGFSFDGECLDAWLTRMTAPTMTLLFVHQGRRIESIRIGDPDVILPCF